MSTCAILDWRAQFKRLDGAHALSTICSYYSDVEVFETWCHERALSPAVSKKGMCPAYLPARQSTATAETCRLGGACHMRLAGL